MNEQHHDDANKRAEIIAQFGEFITKPRQPVAEPRNHEDANKLATIITLICTKRSPNYKSMIMCYETGEWVMTEDGIKPVLRSIATEHLAALCEDVQKMDDKLLEVARRGAQDAIMNYLYGGE